ncbi:hypothetical protein SEA_MOOSEHEAD_7 [Gordonia phage Moosehead]|nr:hypothetical protein SEA_MOOSEHEAD_7 [Gordonia phage Moosehead]
MALISSGTAGATPARRAGPDPKEDDMALKTYDVEINGYTTTLRLSDADAKERGLAASEAPKKEPAAKKATPANKSRTAANKAAG